MTRIASTPSLLHAALQDLHAGYRDQAARLPAAAARDPGLCALLGADRAQSAARAARLEGAGINPAGSTNLWTAGVLDNAERDAASTEPGRLLDIALAGAIRKGKASETVACDTALALLADEPGLADLLTDLRGESAAADAALLAAIHRLSAPAA